MPVYEWIIIIVVGGLCAICFLYNLYGFLAEIFGAVGSVLKGEKPHDDYSDPHWSGKL